MESAGLTPCGTAAVAPARSAHLTAGDGETSGKQKGQKGRETPGLCFSNIKAHEIEAEDWPQVGDEGHSCGLERVLGWILDQKEDFRGTISSI